MITLSNIDDYFTYHPPETQSRIDAHNKVNRAAKAWATEFLKWVLAGKTDDIGALNKAYWAFLKCTEKHVGDHFCLEILQDSLSRYNSLRGFDDMQDNHSKIVKGISEIQFCRMMANQAIAIASLPSRKED
jgi:hypothetical protein